MIRFCLIIFTSVFLLNFSACKRPSEEHAIKVVSLKGPSAMGTMKMMKDELKYKDSLSFCFQILNEPNQVRSMLIQESPDFAMVPSNMAAIMYNRGLPYQLAAVPCWGTLYLFGSDPEVKNLEDLKGKTVYLMTLGMNPDITFRYLLEKNGLVPNEDVKLDYRFPTHIELANAATAGEAPLAVISEPLVSMAIHKNPELRIILSLDSLWKVSHEFNESMPQTGLLVRKDFARKHPDIVDFFMDAYSKSSAWVNENPAEASDLMVKYKIFPDPVIGIQAIPRCNLYVKPAEQIKPVVQDYLKVLLNFNPNSTGGKLPDEDFYLKK